MTELKGYLASHMFGAASAVPFALARWRYERMLRRVPAPPGLAEHSRILERDGVVIIDGFLQPDQVRAICEALPPVSEYQLSPEGDRSYFYPAARRLPALTGFFDDPRLGALARAHISAQALPLRETVGLKAVRGDFPAFDRNFHMDTWKRRLKAFLFLHDITPREAPMVYLRGSHRGRWRLWTEARIARYYEVNERGFAADPDRFFLGSFWPHEVQQLRRDYGFEDLVCTGSAGSLLVFDGRGLHKATALTGTRRHILTSYWIHPGQHT